MYPNTTPQMGIGRVYLKPLVPHGISLDPATVLQKLKGSLLRRLRSKLTQETFSDRAKKALSKALRIEVRQSSLLIIAKHPAWRPLVEGQRKGQMSWLAKAKAPIPIVTETGAVIFRSATPKSMANGRWIHPGRKPSHFYDRAKQEAREFLRDRLKKEFARRLAGTLQQ